MAINHKQLVTAEYVAESLDFLTSLTIVTDSSGSVNADAVLINVGAVAATTNVGAQIGVFDQRGATDAGWDALPGFGTVTQPVYTGMVFKIAYELAGAPKTYYMAMGEMFNIIAELVKRGAAVELWQIANGNAPTIANIAANGTLQATFHPNLYWQLSDRA